MRNGTKKNPDIDPQRIRLLPPCLPEESAANRGGKKVVEKRCIENAGGVNARTRGEDFVTGRGRGVERGSLLERQRKRCSCFRDSSGVLADPFDGSASVISRYR